MLIIFKSTSFLTSNRQQARSELLLKTGHAGTSVLDFPVSNLTPLDPLGYLLTFRAGLKSARIKDLMGLKEQIHLLG